MKKKLNLFSAKSNKKGSTMTHSNLHGNKKDIYIYTEADLGEGILDEGVDPSYYASTIENNEIHEMGYNFKSDSTEIKNYSLEKINVEEDFNYAYYL